MIRIAIIDDEELICFRIKRFLECYSQENAVAIEIYLYQNENLFLSDLKNNIHFDLIFLDIELRNTTGIQIGHWIRNEMQDEWMQIIYISGKEGYERQLFSVNCLDFLSKPISYKEISRVMNRFMKLTHRPEDVFVFQKNHVLERIPLSNILYFESKNRKIFIVTQIECIEFYEKLDEIEKRLPVQFLRIHKSFLVNYCHIRQFHYDEVIMSNQKNLPISQSKRKAIKEVQLELEGIMPHA